MDNESWILTTVGFLLIFLTLFLAFFVKFSSIGYGEHSGFITAVDENGYIFRNYDVYFKTDNSSSQEDTYCIHRNDRELVKKAQEINKTRQQITIKYKGVRAIGLGLCGYSQILSIE